MARLRPLVLAWPLAFAWPLDRPLPLEAAVPFGLVTGSGTGTRDIQLGKNASKSRRKARRSLSTSMIRRTPSFAIRRKPYQNYQPGTAASALRGRGRELSPASGLRGGLVGLLRQRRHDLASQRPSIRQVAQRGGEGDAHPDLRDCYFSFSATLAAISYSVMVSACHGVLPNQKLPRIGGLFHHESPP